MQGYLKNLDLPEPKLGKRHNICERCDNKWTDEVKIYYHDVITSLYDYCDNCITEEEKNER